MAESKITPKKQRNVFNVVLSPENEEYIRIMAMRDNVSKTQEINLIIEHNREIPENQKAYDRIKKALKG